MALSLGTNFTLVVTEHGDLYAFGTNRNGQLGLGTTENQLLPALVDKVQAFAGEEIVSVSCGCAHSAGVTRNDNLFVWGCNEEGQLGLDLLAQPVAVFEIPAATTANDDAGTTTATVASTSSSAPPAIPSPDSHNIVRPLLVPRASFNNAPVRMVACGQNFTLALTKYGRVFSTGANDCGQLGLNDTTSRRIFSQIDPAFFADHTITLIAAGYRHCMALSAEDGALFGWGLNAWFQLGMQYISCKHPVPIVVPTESFGGGIPVFVDAGDNYSMVVTSDGGLYGCGANNNYQLGLGDNMLATRMKRVGDAGKFHGQRVRSVRCGSQHSIILTDDNTLWACGLSTDPLCGISVDRVACHVKVPTRIPHARFHGNDVIVFSAGVSHSAAITSKGELYTWGEGVSYERSYKFKFSGLGLNNTHIQWLPRKVLAASLGGARVGAWNGIRQDILLAFMMATHKRLGERCVFQGLLCEIISIIIAPVCVPKTLDGLQDLLGRLPK